MYDGASRPRRGNGGQLADTQRRTLFEPRDAGTSPWLGCGIRVVGQRLLCLKLSGTPGLAIGTTIAPDAGIPTASYPHYHCSTPVLILSITQPLFTVRDAMNTQPETNGELLRLHGEAVIELEHRNIGQEFGNPLGGLTEAVVCRAFNLVPTKRGNPIIDATDPRTKERYQIKGRWDPLNTGKYQMSAIRNIGKHQFDFVVVVIFNRDFSVRLAIRIPYGFVRQFTTRSEHTNSDRLSLSRKIIDDCGEENDFTIVVADAATELLLERSPMKNR